MAETVAKQLHFSPVATPLPQQQQVFGFQQVQQRLDARPDWTAGQQAAGELRIEGSSAVSCSCSCYWSQKVLLLLQ